MPLTNMNSEDKNEEDIQIIISDYQQQKLDNPHLVNFGCKRCKKGLVFTADNLISISKQNSYLSILALGFLVVLSLRQSGFVRRPSYGTSGHFLCYDVLAHAGVACICRDALSLGCCCRGLFNGIPCN